jgi:hypothetical protein
MATRFVQFRLPEEEHRALRHLALERETPVDRLVRDAVRAAYPEIKPSAPPATLAPNEEQLRRG